MPFKKAKAKVKAKAKRPFNKRRKFKQNKETMINRMPRSSHTVIAPHFYTTLESSFYGGIHGNTGTTDVGQFAIGTNIASLPFNSAAAFTGMNMSFLSPGTNALNALNPVGFTRLSTLYKSYRVYKYWVQVIATPASDNDAVGLSMVPCNGDALNNVIGLSQQEIMSLPYSKSILCTKSNIVKGNRVFSSMMPRTLLGLTKLQYKDELSSAGQIGSDPDLYTSVVVTYNTIDGATLSADLYFEVKLRLWLEFFDPVSDLSID